MKMIAAIDSRDKRSFWCLIAISIVAYLPAILAVLSGGWPFGSDAIAIIRPWREITRQALIQGILPLWNPHTFCGQPLMSNGQTVILYPLTWMYCLMPVRVAMLVDAVIHNIMLSLGVYVLARSLGQRRTGAWIAAVALALGGAVSARLYAGYITWHAARAYLPWELACLLLYLRTGQFYFVIVTVVLFALQCVAGFPPVTVLSMALACGLLLARTITHLRVARAKANNPQKSNLAAPRLAAVPTKIIFPRHPPTNASGLPQHWLKHLGVGAILLMALLTVYILPLMGVVHESARGSHIPYSDVARYSFSWRSALRLIVPGFFGGNEVPEWSMEFSAHEEVAYTGTLVLCLALGSPLLARCYRARKVDAALGPAQTTGSNPVPEDGSNLPPAVPWLWALLPIAILLAIGPALPFHHWLYTHIAHLSILRSPARWMEVWSFTVPLLAGFSFDNCYRAAWLQPRPAASAPATTSMDSPAISLADATGLDAAANTRMNRAVRWLQSVLWGLSCALILLALIMWWIPTTSDLWMKKAQWAVAVKGANTHLFLASYLHTTAILQSFQAWVFVLGYAVLSFNCWRARQPRKRQLWKRLLVAVATLDVLMLFWQSNNSVMTDTLQYKVLWPASLLKLYDPTQRWTTAVDVFGMNSHQTYALDCFNGYDPLSGRRYFEFVQALEKREFWKDAYEPSSYGPLLRVAGVTHTLTRNPTPPKTEDGVPPPRLIARAQNWSLWQYSGAWPRVYLSRRLIRQREDAQLSTLNTLAQHPFNLTTAPAVVGSNDFAALGLKPMTGSLSSQDKVMNWQRTLNTTTIKTTTAQASLLVQGETFSPGWRAYINGVPRPLARANYLFRGVSVPSGTAQTVLVYEPQPYRFGLFISLCGLAAMMVMLVNQARKLFTDVCISQTH